MKQEKLEDRLQMRRLTVDDTAQYNALLRYAFQVTDSELASLGWNQKEMERSKKPVLKKTESFGWFDGEKLASQISVYPMQVNLFGTMYNMGGATLFLTIFAFVRLPTTVVPSLSCSPRRMSMRTDA